jgi:hypothetical protein
MIKDQAALTVTDLLNNHSHESNRIDYTDDHSTVGCVDEDDDDSFLANSSLCKQHRSAIEMLDSLRREVVEMVRNDDKYATPKKSPQDVTIDLNSSTELSSPLTSPLLSRTIISMNKNAQLPVFNTHSVTPHTSDSGHPRQGINSDDSTFCSIDHSIENEMNILKEVVKNLEKELKTENLNTVFEAIERIGNSDDPVINSLLHSEDKDVLREGIRTELLKKEQSIKPKFMECRLRDTVDFFWSIEIDSMNLKIFIASIVVSLIYKYISTWQE